MKLPKPFLKPAFDEVTAADWAKLKKDFEEVSAKIAALGKTTAVAGTSLSSIGKYSRYSLHGPYTPPFGTMLRYDGRLTGMEAIGMVVGPSMPPGDLDHVRALIISGDRAGSIQHVPLSLWHRFA